MSFSSDSIRVLQVIAQTRSFSEAAKVLHRVPSAISYTAKKMEEELGIVLFERSGGHVQLTPAALHILTQGDWILQGLQDLCREAVRIADGVEREFTIALNYVVNPAPVVRLLALASEAFPTTAFSVRTEVYNGAWDALYEGRADLVIGAPQNPPWNDGIATEYLGEVEWVFLTAPTHPLAAEREQLNTVQLRRFPAIVVHDSSIALQRKKTWALKGQKVMYAADLRMALEMIAAGLGIGFVPRSFASDALRCGRVVEKSIAEHKQPVKVYYARHAQPHNRISDFLLEHLRTAQFREQWLC